MQPGGPAPNVTMGQMGPGQPGYGQNQPMQGGMHPGGQGHIRPQMHPQMLQRQLSGGNAPGQNPYQQQQQQHQF